MQQDVAYLFTSVSLQVQLSSQPSVGAGASESLTQRSWTRAGSVLGTLPWSLSSWFWIEWCCTNCSKLWITLHIVCTNCRLRHKRDSYIFAVTRAATGSNFCPLQLIYTMTPLWAGRGDFLWMTMYTHIDIVRDISFKPFFHSRIVVWLNMHL